MFARREAKTRIRQRDWLTKQRTFSPTNHVAEFSFSLRVARTNSPSGKRALVTGNLVDSGYAANKSSWKEGGPIFFHYTLSCFLFLLTIDNYDQLANSIKVTSLGTDNIVKYNMSEKNHSNNQISKYCFKIELQISEQHVHQSKFHVTCMVFYILQ